MCLVCPQDLEYVQDQQCVCLLNSYLCVYLLLVQICWLF